MRYNPPPDASLISNTQLIAELWNVGTFNPQFFNEVRQNAAAPLGADGFAPPSLLSLFAFPQTFFHNGAATSLEAAFAGAQGQFAGLDKLNVQLPTTLRGRGELPVIFSIDGQTSNTVSISIR